MIRIALPNLGAAIGSLWSIGKQLKVEYKKRALANRKKRIAIQFNRLYTYENPYVEDAPILDGTWLRARNRWMCPTCNTIHAPYEYSPWTGLQYPKCCGYQAGHRYEVFQK